MESIPYMGGVTYTDSALQYAKDNYFTLVNGMRSQAAQIAIVITDGKSEEQDLTAVEAQRLRDKVRDRRLV